MVDQSCIVFNFYIKSQPSCDGFSLGIVVQYSISQTNHNAWTNSMVQKLLYSIQFLHQITTGSGGSANGTQLYSIQFLHQITTFLPLFLSAAELYSIQFLHQITTFLRRLFIGNSCIVFNFIDKSQRMDKFDGLEVVVQYSISTSNHNRFWRLSEWNLVVQYSISTSNHNFPPPISLRSRVVQYSISTSNHNGAPDAKFDSQLYSIQFLHQITTVLKVEQSLSSCIVFNFYIKSQLSAVTNRFLAGCIVFNFYIKSQLEADSQWQAEGCIVFNFYIKSQPEDDSQLLAEVVQYSISTSNHNTVHFSDMCTSVVQYSISTSNHNLELDDKYSFKLYSIQFLHQITTCNRLAIAS